MKISYQTILGVILFIEDRMRFEDTYPASTKLWDDTGDDAASNAENN